VVFYGLQFAIPELEIKWRPKMKYVTLPVTIFVLSVQFMTISAFGGEAPLPCVEMDKAATALAQVNGANFAWPSERLPETPTETDKGQAYSYGFDVIYSRGDEAPNKKVGTIKATALRKNGETKCKVLTLEFSNLE
jgi:hypothetical protein